MTESNMIKIKPKNDLAIILLSAGKGSRFRSIKPLAQFNNQSFLSHQLCTCLNAVKGVADLKIGIHVILGAYYSEVSEHLLRLTEATTSHSIGIHKNLNWEDGLSSSIHCAVQEVGPDYQALLFIAVDQIALTSSQLIKFVHSWKDSKADLFCTQYDVNNPTTLGIPCIFSRIYYQELLNIQGDKGARALIQRVIKDTPENLQSLLIPEAQIDIDTPEALHHFIQQQNPS